MIEYVHTVIACWPAAGHVHRDHAGHHRRVPPAVRPPLVRDVVVGQVRPRRVRVDGLRRLSRHLEFVLLKTDLSKEDLFNK